MSIISDSSQGDSPSKLNPLAHKRKMGSTRRPLRGNKEKRNNADEKEAGASEGVAEVDTDLHSETQEQNNVIDDNIIQTINVSDNEEHERTETVRKSTQELCDDAVDKAEVTSEQQLRSSSNVCQTQEGSPQYESENILKSEMDVREEKETENNDEEIFAFEDISSEVTVTPQAQNKLFIQTTDADSHDYIQTVKDVHEESQGEEMFLSANANLTIQDNDSQSDFQTENSKQNYVLTDDQNTNTTPHINVEERQETEPNVLAVTDSGLSFGDSGESQKELENINDVPEDSQEEEKQSKIKPLVHQRKMGSTRRPLKGNKGQRKDREQDDDSETLNNEEKEEEREISGGKDTGPVEELDSTIIQSSCNAEKSTEKSICDITESQTTTKCHGESQENAGDIESLPTGGDTEAHLEIRTDIGMLDSTMNKEGTEENICDDDVLMRQVVFVGDTVTEESNMTIESDLLQNNTSLDTHQEALKSSENVENVSTVADSGLLLQDVVLVGSGEKTEMSIISDSSQGDSPSKLNPLAHKRKMGSTRRPLRGNKEKRNNAEEKEAGGSEGVAEVDTDLHSETQEQNNVIDDNIIKTINVSDNEEHERTETVRKSTQELCDDAVDKAEVTSEQQLRSSSNACQTQDGSPQYESENMMKSEMDVREEKENENNDEEIFAFEDISSEVTVTPQAQNKLFIQTTDADSHDYIQTVKDVHEESQGEEMFLSANANLTIQDNDSQSDFQTENSKQNYVLTDDQNTNTTPHINVEERQETEPNVLAVTDSGLSFGGSGESQKELENITDIPEDSQKVQSKLNPLVHKRKMGSTRRPTGENKGQRKDREWHAEFQKNYGDSEAHLEFQTEIKTFDSTVDEGIKDHICDDDVLMTQAEFVGDKLTVESNMTIESDFLQNNTSLDTNQEALKSSENVENISTLIHSGLVLQDVATESSLESNTVPEKSESSIIPEDSHVEDSHSKLNPVVHKRKMGSTRRPLRGNKDKEDLREVKEEDMEPHSEIQEQNDVVDHDTMQKRMDVRHNKEENSILRLPVQELCEHLSENKEWHSDITLEQEQTSSNISQTQTAPSQDDACESLPEIQESNTFVLSEALSMEENQIHVSEPVVTVGTPQIEDGKIQSVFSKSVQKRKMGSTRKTQRGQRNEKERELGEELDGETKIATTKEDTIKPQENFILEEVMSLTITETHAHQQPSSLPTNKEGHLIENNGSKMNNQTESPEQNEMQMQNDPNSNTNPHQNQDKSEILISEKSHTENIHSNMNPTAQKRKMGSTRKTLRGNGRRAREVESKEIDGDSERTLEEHSTEFATIERAHETKLDENTQLKETRSTESLTHPVATSKIFFETEDGEKKVSTNIVGLSVVSEEIRSNEAPSEAFCTDLQSEMLVSADEMKVCEKYDGPSGLENLDKSKSLEEVESEPQLQLTVLDQSHQMHSGKHPRSENVTPERRRKIGSTRKNLRGKRGDKKREESESNQFAPEKDQDGETSMIREAEPDQIIHNSFEESDTSLLGEIERALRKTSPSLQNTDYQLIVNEPNLAETPETSHFNTPENSEPEQGSDKEKHGSLQVTESQNQSEIGSPRRRRKMGSTRKNPRQQIQAKREDENEEDETEEKNKQESKSLKKDLEAAEESKVHDSRDNVENKEYLDVPVALTNSCQTEESTNSVGKEGTSPSTKRKFGSRRTNVGNRDLGGMIPPDLTEDTGARLVSLDQMIKASQHDGQTAGLKNISDMEVVQFNVVMVGNSSVGKTSFVRRFHGGEFSSDYSSTIGVDTCVQNIVFHDRVVKLQIWDTAGQERFHSITTQVFHRADGLFLMYEVTSWMSFISVRDWISQIQDVNAAEEKKDGGTHTFEERATTEEIWLLLR
ncbi:extracellular matrix-binding protein ebh isoform X2 [Triplophysa dalaica]|uniref:extracellular matrix-binding protein ebh isoform X2 n=1 Tax=Triplophysa dalaica TaxID=1582913 RepID=UPI0024DFE3AF|nr:extracellular matrix-binding protein ebh isoform X2 [Triplophysa dalaica]